MYTCWTSGQYGKGKRLFCLNSVRNKLYFIIKALMGFFLFWCENYCLLFNHTIFKNKKDWQYTILGKYIWYEDFKNVWINIHYLIACIRVIGLWILCKEKDSRVRNKQKHYLYDSFITCYYVYLLLFNMMYIDSKFSI